MSNTAVAEWWQRILNDPNFSMVIEAAKFQLEQEPPQFAGVTSMESMALIHAAHRGGSAALAALETLGSETLLRQRVAEERMRAAAEAFEPARAGHGPGLSSPPPPEIAGMVPPPQPSENG